MAKMLLKIFLILLCYVRHIKSQATLTINSQADATALAASYSTISASVQISADVTGAISLDGVQLINGDLVVVGAVNLTSLSGKDLTKINGTMQLTGLTILSTLSFPELTTVGAIEWTALPGLQQLTFTSGIQLAPSILISDTQMNSIAGIFTSTAGRLSITHNPYMNSISLAIRNVTESLVITDNAQDVQVDFESLEWLTNGTFSNCSEVLIPNLQTVHGGVSFTQNSFSKLEAPYLQSASGSFVISGSYNLSNLSIPLLQSLQGGMDIENNSVLSTILMPALNYLGEDLKIIDNNVTAIDGFPDLVTVEGNIDIEGSFEKAVFPKLGNVNGNFKLNTTSNFDCSVFDQDKSNQIIRGSYSCIGQNVTSINTHSGSFPTTSTRGSGPTTTGACYTSGTLTASCSPLPNPGPPLQVQLGIGLGIGLTGLISLLIGAFILSKRRKNRSPNPAGTTDPGIPELPLGAHYEKAELGAKERPLQLPQGGYHETVELGGGERPAELPREGYSEQNGWGVESKPAELYGSPSVLISDTHDLSQSGQSGSNTSVLTGSTKIRRKEVPKGSVTVGSSSLA